MKVNSFQFGLCISVVCHVVGFGVVALAVFTVHSPALEQKESVITLTLIAAPADPVNSPEVTRVAPLPIPPPTPRSSSPATALAPPPLPAPSQNDTRGDGSSTIPGKDATTLKVQPGVKAEPNYLKNPEPSYPLLARRRHQEGTVLLNVKVTAQGHAARITLKHSSGYPLLDEAALQAVPGWEFAPARIGLVPVESEIEVPVRFQLTN